MQNQAETTSHSSVVAIDTCSPILPCRVLDRLAKFEINLVHSLHAIRRRAERRRRGRSEQAFIQDRGYLNSLHFDGDRLHRIMGKGLFENRL
jgi:hypothetical protein